MKNRFKYRLLASALSVSMIVSGFGITAMAGEQPSEETVEGDYGPIVSTDEGTIIFDRAITDVALAEVEVEVVAREGGHVIIDPETEEPKIIKGSVYAPDLANDKTGSTYYTNYYLNMNYDKPLIIRRSINLHLNGKNINGNREFGGPTIYVGTGATVNIYDTASNDGYKGTIYGGKPSYAENAGGILVEGELVMHGGKISLNHADEFLLDPEDEDSEKEPGYGGGVNVAGTFIMEDGVITGNTATEGAGVYVDGGTFEMYGGSIENNIAAGDGGGVYVKDGTFKLCGGSVTGNDSSGKGDGVYCENGTVVLGSGKSVINENKGNNLYLEEDAYVQLTSDAGVPDPSSVIRLTAAGDERQFFTSGWGENIGLDKVSEGIFMPDNDSLGTAVVKDDDDKGEIGFGKPEALIKRDDILNNFETVRFALKRAETYDTVTLLSDAEVNEAAEAFTTVSLDLNGHALSSSEDTPVRVTNDEGKIVIKDSSSEKKGYITGTTAGVDVQAGEIVLDGVTVKGSGTGAVVGDGAVLTLNGAVIRDNGSKDIEGGGIDSSGTVNVISGEITGNKSSKGGGISLKNGGLLNVGPGVVMITGNTNESGAADNVYLAEEETYISLAGKLEKGSVIGVGFGFEAAEGGFAHIPFTTGWSTASYGTDRNIFTSDSNPALYVQTMTVEGGAKELCFEDIELKKISLQVKRGSDSVNPYAVKVGDEITIKTTPDNVDKTRLSVEWYRRSSVGGDDTLISSGQTGYTVKAADNDEKIYAFVTYEAEGAEDPIELRSAATGRVGRDYSAYIKDDDPQEDEDGNQIIYVIEMDNFRTPLAGMGFGMDVAEDMLDTPEALVYDAGYYSSGAGADDPALGESDIAVKGQSYEVRMDLFPDQYYTFAPLNRLVLLKDGEKADAKFVSADEENDGFGEPHVIMSYGFKVTDEAYMIDTLSFTGVENKVGAAFNKNIKLETKNAAISAIRYYKASDPTRDISDGTVEDLTDYKLEITVMADENYAFSSPLSVKINGVKDSGVTVERIQNGAESGVIITYPFNSSRKGRFLSRIFLQKFDGSYPEKADIETVVSNEYKEEEANAYKPDRQVGFTLSFRQMVTENQDVIYEYDGTRNSYNIKLDPNGGVMEVKDYSLKLKFGETFPELPPVTKEGSTLYGWNTKADGTGSNYKKDSVVDFDAENDAQITLYANWTGSSSTVSADDVEKLVKQSYEDALAALSGSKTEVDTIGAKDDTALVRQLYSKGKNKLITIVSIPETGGKVTVNAGVKLKVPEGFALNGAPVSKTNGAKLPKLKVSAKGIMTLKPVKKAGEYSFTLVKASTKTVVEVRVVNAMFDKSLKKLAVSTTAKAAADNALSKGGEELTIRTTRIKDDIKNPTGLVSGLWMVGKTKVPNVKPGEETAINVKGVNVVVKADYDGNLILAPAEGSGSGKVPVACMINGKLYKTSIAVTGAPNANQETVRTAYTSAGLLKSVK